MFFKLTFSQFFSYQLSKFNLITIKKYTGNCKSCKIVIDPKTSRPNETSFRKYIPYFVNDIPDENCAKAGRAAYFDVSSTLLETIAFR